MNTTSKQKLKLLQCNQLHTKLLQKNITHVICVHVIYRVRNNLAVVFARKTYFDAMYMNKGYHLSKETFFPFYTSFVVTRGSPLQAKNALFNP